MLRVWTLCVLLAVQTILSRCDTFVNYPRAAASDPCNPKPCGANTRCTVNARGVAVCRCLDGFFPKPNTIAGCGPQCVTDDECGSDRFVCRQQKCVNPCVGGTACGVNANCDVRSRQVVCSCPAGYEGNAYVSCHLAQSSSRASSFHSAADHVPSVIGRVRSSSLSRFGNPTITGNPAITGNPVYPAHPVYPASSYHDIPPCLTCGAASGAVQARGPPAPPSDPCSGGSVCGLNAQCVGASGRAVCSCPAGFSGDPLTSCRRGECSYDSECARHKACIDVLCQDPCALGQCGVDAKCTVENHRAICSCPQNYIGDPLTRCRYDPQAACTPSPCGQNTKCRVQNGRAVCSCIADYIGDPLSGCRPECTADSECLATQNCVQNRCRNACTGACGRQARCTAVNHRALCSCPQYFLGDGLTGCYAECTRHSECAAHQACVQLRCTDPCADSCGVGAECTVEQHQAICKCPAGHEGHPFERCYPAAPTFTQHDPAQLRATVTTCSTACSRNHQHQRVPQTPHILPTSVSGDMCSPNPCGANAECNHGTDRSGSPRPVCTCPRGYLGDPLSSCRRGECVDSSECSSSQSCYNYVCVSPCVDSGGLSVCGTNAQCDAKGHKAVCSCPREYTGDPLTECRLKPIARSNTGRRFTRALMVRTDDSNIPTDTSIVKH